MRVRLRSGVHLLWRGDDGAQVGFLDTSPLVFSGLSTTQKQYLADLAARHGVLAHRNDRICAALREAGYLISYDEPVATDELQSTLDSAHVGILGLGLTGATFALNLVKCGLKVLTIMDDAPVLTSDVSIGSYNPKHVGMPRHRALEKLVTAQAPGCTLLPPTESRPDLVVIVDQYVAHPRLTSTFIRHDVPHLSVVLTERRSVIGPYVVPGQSCCVRCLDLHRADHDKYWRAVATQLAALGQHHPLTEDPGLALATASTMSNQILAVLSRTTPTTRGATLEITLPEALPNVRTWPIHPHCGCDAVGIP